LKVEGSARTTEKRRKPGKQFVLYPPDRKDKLMEMSVKSKK